MRENNPLVAAIGILFALGLAFDSLHAQGQDTEY